MIRSAKLGDEKAIFDLICALALFEKAPDEVINTVENLRKDLFEEPICEAIVVEENDIIVGFALFYVSYSTWRGKCLYLEDIYVLPEFRQQRFGQQLFDEVVSIAKKWKVKRMDWQVLDWNEGAINFYKKNEAHLDAEWINGRFFFND